MPSRILVPLDGSPEGEVVLAHLNRMAGPETSVCLLHVIPDPNPPVGAVPTGVFRIHGRIQDYLEGLSVRVAQANVKTLVRIGKVADRIVQASMELDIQLIMMATHTRGSMPNAFTEDVAEAVVRGSSLPVILVRPGLPDPGPVRRLLVPVDGTRRSFRILESLRTLALKGPVEAAFLQVAPRPVVVEPWTEFASSPEGAASLDPESSLEECVRALDADDFRTRAVIAHGDPVAEILSHGKRIEADLIAMALAGRSRHDRSVLGSAASALLRRMDRPLFLHRVVDEPPPFGAGSRRFD